MSSINESIPKDVIPHYGKDAEATGRAASTCYNQLGNRVTGIDNGDTTSRYQPESGDSKPCAPPLPSACLPPINSCQRKIVFWSASDPENPYNWSTPRKIYIVSILCITVLNSTFGSSLPSNAIPYIMEEYGVTNKQQAVLPISIFLIGYVLGPLFFGPLSEQYGRKMIVIVTFVGFIVFTVACALTPSWTAFIIFRLFCGITASAPIVVVGGVYADIYDDPNTRGLAMSIFMAATGVGPLFAPIVSGYVSPVLGWRWSFWVGTIIAGACLPPMLFIPETYGPVLLARRAANLRKITSNPNIFAPFELETQGFKQLATITLTRPVRLLFFELIVAATCLYLSIAYSIFYMSFEAYPIIFQGLYNMTPGFAGLMFLSIALGEFLALPVFIFYDAYLQRAKRNKKPWSRSEESRRLPLACIGGPLYVIALFWLGWSARHDVHWSVPFLSGISFGLGFELIFMALLNYLTDAYEIFAASVMAAASCSRSVFGAVLPLATTSMFDALGVAWACSLLAFLSLLMCGIPFGFLRWGGFLRERSRFCIYLKERKEKELLELAKRGVREQINGA